MGTLKKLKYIEAYDYVNKTWILPEDVMRGYYHDPMRYFSREITDYEYQNGVLDDCVVLTLNKGGTYTRKGKTYTRRKHFTSIGAYTSKYIKQTKAKTASLETKVHKEAKSLFEYIKGLSIPIRVPDVDVNVFGMTQLLLQDIVMYITEIVSIEKKIDNTSRIPDIVCQCAVYSKKQFIANVKIAFEICVRHEVSSTKRQEYIDNNINCLEVNVLDVINSSDSNFKLDIISRIAKDSYWISNNVASYFEKEAKRRFVPINSRNILQPTKSLRQSTEYDRYFFFKDDAENIGAVCNGMPNFKSTSYGWCRNCEYCEHFHDSDNIDEVLILHRKYDNKTLKQLAEESIQYF